MSASLQSVERDGLRQLIAENELVRVVVLPACGGKIASIFDKARNTEWMWSNPHLPLRPPRGSKRYVQEFDNGGWDECFPSIAPGTIRHGPLKGLAVHDHGELWSREWFLDRMDCNEGAATIGLSTTLESISVRVSRTLTVDARLPSIRLDYRLQNLGEVELPYIWASHPLIPLDSGMRIEAPPGSRFDVSLVGDCAATPRLDASGVLALPEPATNGARGQCFKGVFRGDFRQPITLRRADGAALSYRFGADDFDGVALWCNAGAWSGCGSAPYNNIGFEPQKGLSDDLAEAIASGGPLASLAPRETRCWGLDIILS